MACIGTLHRSDANIAALYISVSVLALEEFNSLQQKYELEAHCRFEAEKYAAEVNTSNAELQLFEDYLCVN